MISISGSIFVVQIASAKINISSGLAQQTTEIEHAMRIYAEPISHWSIYIRSESPPSLLPTSLGRLAVTTGLKTRLGPQDSPSYEAESIGSRRCSALTYMY